MRLEFFGDPIERKIAEEILAWSKHVLEVPSPHFAGLPPCPYAKQAWLEDRVLILFLAGNLQNLYSTISQFEDSVDIVIIVDPHPTSDTEKFHSYLDNLNDVISEGMFIDRDIWLMGFHPDDEASDFVEDVNFEPVTNVRYSMIFVQRLSKLQESADKLRKKGYYDSYEKEYNAGDIYRRRQLLYEKLKGAGHGDETS
jgi:hypothetical protein